MLVLLLLAIQQSLATRTWPVRDTATLLQVLAQTEPGDVIELDPGEYIFSTPPAAAQLAPLLINKPLTLRSRDKRQRAILRNDGSATLIAITSPLVTLSDLVVGAQRSGADERSIDILIGAGTQTAPANANAYYNSVGASSAARMTPSRTEIAAARALQLSAGGAEQLRKRSAAVFDSGSMRVLHDVTVQNVDFGGSRSGANIGFARGSYSDVKISECAFGRVQTSHINAIVSVGDAQFAAFGVHGNTFLGDTHVLIGSPAVEPESLAQNYWGTNGKPHVYIGGSHLAPETYCLDLACERLAPIVDSAKPRSAYSSLYAALAANVQRIVITDDIELSAPAYVTQARTTIEGDLSCDGAPLVTVSTGGAIVSIGGALAGVRNVRMALRGASALGFIYTDGSAQRLVVARFVQDLLVRGDAKPDDGAVSTSVSLFDGVSIMGDGAGDQIALLLSAPKVRVELEDAVVAQVQYGAVVHRGALVTVDSSFFAASGAAIYAETITHQAALRVGGTTFTGCGGAAIELGAGASSNNLREFHVSCSQFLFNKQRNPIVSHDCAKKPTLCAAALSYNTIISDSPLTSESDAADQRMFKQGANHVEHGRRREDYLYFGSPKQQFALSDTQGRLSWVTGSLSANAANAAFLLATYAPMRGECFQVDGISPDASVVSDVLEVRSDSLLHACTSMGARFRIDDASSLPASLAVYGVSHLGAHSQWVRAISTTHPAGGNQATIESTIAVHSVADDKHTHRIVVVALETLPEKLALALNAGIATTADTPRIVNKRLCAVCGSNTMLPAHYLDDYCGGSTDNVRTSFDAAYTELGFGASSGPPRANGASIYVFGECKTNMCSVTLDHNEHLEGTSPTVRGTLRRSSSADGCSDTQPLIVFNGRSSAFSSLRYMVLADERSSVSVRIDAPTAHNSGTPTVAYCTLSTSLSVNGRVGGRFINNDFGKSLLFVGGAAQRVASDPPVIVEANQFAAGGIQVNSSIEVRVDRNKFVQGGSIYADKTDAVVHVTANENLSKVHGVGKLSVLGNSLAPKALVDLKAGSAFAGGAASVTGAQFVLAKDARVTGVKFDSSSQVFVDGSSTVVMREVRFDSIGKTLQTERSFHSCAAFEVEPKGIDLARSLIFTAKGEQTLTADQQRQINADAARYWALDGSLARCSDGAPVQRSVEFCGCAADQHHVDVAEFAEPVLVEPQDKQFSIRKAVGAVLEKGLQESITVAAKQTLETSTTSNTVIVVILIVLGVVILLCLLVACVIAVQRSGRATAETAAARAKAVNMYAVSAAPAAAVMHHHEESAYTVRKRVVPAKNK